jgi:uncharacterized protein YbaR (Trm112 family)
MLRPDLLAIVCCPEDHSPLATISDTLLSKLNGAIARRQLRNRAGRILEQPLDGGLQKASGELLYPIIDGIPILVREEAIPLDQLQPADGN